MENFIDILGFIAASLTTFAFVPQVLLIYKTKDTSSISLGMFAIFSTGVLCWGVYGFYLNQYPIIIANFITFLLAFYILVMKLTEKSRQK